MKPIKVVFLDIGGVLLTNGWDRNARKLAADTFALDFADMDERHHLTFDTYEEGKLNLEEYLDRVIFYRTRPFTSQEFKDFMFAQSKPYPLMIDLIRGLKEKYGFRVATISNEGRELTIYRIQQFKLDGFVDFFISSCFVHYRKPDADIYKMALDAAQVEPSESLYVEDRPLFADVASGLGIQTILHQDYPSTRSIFENYGLSLPGSH